MAGAAGPRLDAPGCQDLATDGLAAAWAPSQARAMKADQAIDTPSGKEREALRLLLAGHDAKSSARKLGVWHQVAQIDVKDANED